MNTPFTSTSYLVFLGGLLLIGLICLLSQLSRHIPAAELDKPLPPPEDDRARDPSNWPPPVTWQERAQELINSQRDELLTQ